MRGLDIAVIGLIAFFGIAFAVGMLIYQAGVGSKQSESIRQTAEIGKPFAQLEEAKRFLAQDLVFSSDGASLLVAEQGGSTLPARYWVCNNAPTTPTAAEVQHALSLTASAFMEQYVNTTKQLISNLTVAGYNCADIKDPGKDSCRRPDSSRCEGFPSAAS
ncbi:MAG: hypothetical protein HY519_01825, partial [Candidatus Aenigmarchaeota archaeon]|nr:hypothetical protein [Candidatus Aenigmarchaeota archaeon]